MSDQVDILKRHLARERAARKQAEELLDSKTLDLHQVNQDLSEATETLKSLVNSRTAIITTLITNLSTGILLENEKGEVMFANKVFCDLFEIPVGPDELIGKELYRSFEVFERIFQFPQHTYDKLQQAFERNQKIDNEEIELKSGLTIEADFIPIDIRGVQKSRLWQFRDVTEKKNAQRLTERSERRFKLLAAYQENILGADLNQLLVKTIDFLKVQVGVDQVSIMIIGSNTEALNNWIKEEVEKTDDPLVDLIAYEETVETDKLAIYRPSIAEEPNEFRDREWLQFYRSDLRMPLILEGDFLGVLHVTSKQIDGISEDTKKFLALLEPQLTYALKNLFLIQDLELSKEIIRQSEEKYRGIMENMELGLMEVANDDTIVKVYDRFCKMTGYEPWELIGRNANEVFLLPEYEPILKAQHQDRDKGKSSVYEIEIPLKNGDRKWVLISGAPFYDTEGYKTGSIGIHLDISDRKKMEQNLRLAKAEAETAQEAEKIFLANMSHEIRNPLNAVIGMAHLLEDSELNAEQREYLGYIKNSSETLLNLISDILDLSKIHANEISFNPKELSMRKLVQDIQSLFQVRCLEKGLAFQFQYDDAITNTIIGDQLILHQILNNLLGNALKFTDEGGKISLFVDLLAKGESSYEIQFTVEDSGIGIKEEYLADIFTDFKQADSSTKIKYGGTGLGLSISKKLVTLHNGSIEVESTEGEGSIFRVTIPFDYTDHTDKPEKREIKGTQEALNVGKVLIVEDNPINRKYLGRTLQKWKISCDEAENGLVALEKLKSNTYDLLIMDIRMPEMDGYETIRHIRKHPEDRIRNITAIALTADAMREEREKAYKLGFNYHITKPFRSEDLRAKLVELEVKKDESTGSESNTAELGDFFDKEALHRLYEGDEEYMMEMFDIFCRTTPLELEKLTDNVNLKDWEACKAILHRAKPTFEMVGRPQLTEIAGKLEAKYDRDKTLSKAELESFMEAVKETVSRVNSEIEKKQKTT